MEQSGGRSRVLCWELVGLICFAGGDTSKQGKPGKPMKPKENKEKQGEPLQSTKEILSNQWDSFLNRGNTLPLSGNAKRLRVMVGIVLLVVDIVCWRGSDTEGTKGNEGRRWRGVGPAGRPSLFSFGGSIVNNLLSLGAEPTNVVRQDGLIEWKSDGYIEVGGVQVWAYYYFEDGEDVDRCDWEDHMEIEVEECWI
ncbi:MAG: hypothetical protein [Bacteriophage sp.]|nr:MAG: hypothetical protein [Bacteriophage sp.]